MTATETPGPADPAADDRHEPPVDAPADAADAPVRRSWWRGRRRRQRRDRGIALTRIVRVRFVTDLVRSLIAVGVFAGLLAILYNSNGTVSVGESWLATPIAKLVAQRSPEAAQFIVQLLQYLITGLPALLILLTPLVTLQFRLAFDVLIAELGVVVVLGVLYLLGHAQTSPWTLLRPMTSIVTLLAMLIVAFPHLGKRWRRVAVGYTVFVVGGFFAFAGPNPLLLGAAAGLGAGVGYLTRFALGRRSAVSTLRGIESALVALGLEVSAIERLDVPASSSDPYRVHTSDGERFVKVTTPSHRETATWLRVVRRVRFRGRESQPTFSTVQLQGAFEGFISGLAAHHGVRTPPIVDATVAPGGEVLLVQAFVEGTLLSAVDDDDLTDEVLAEVWGQALGLQSGRLAHGALRLDNFLRDADGTIWLLDLGNGEYGAPDRTLALDTAELLASTATRVGHARAVAAADAVLGPGRLGHALPVLVPAGLTGTTNKELKARKPLLADLRQTLADAVGGDVNDQVRLTRVDISTLLQVVGIGLAMYLVLPQIANFDSTVKAWQNAHWWMLGGAVVATVFTYFAADLQLLGSVPQRLPFWQTFLVPIAAEFANRVTPAGIGGMALSVAYLRKKGSSPTEAGLSVTLRLLFGVVASFVAFAVLLLVVSDVHMGLSTPKVPGWLTVAVVAAVVIGSAITFSLRSVRESIVSRLRESWVAVKSILARPAGAVTLLAGSFGMIAAYTIAFLFSLYAFGAHLSILAAVTIYLGGSSLGQLIPTPGGVGGIEAVLIAGLTRAGVDSGTAVSAVLTFRLFTYWIPILPSIGAYRALQRRNAI